MTTAEGAEMIRCERGDGNRGGVPLLHLRGTEYGLRVHGLRMDADGRLGADVDGRPPEEESGGCGHG